MPRVSPVRQEIQVVAARMILNDLRGTCCSDLACSSAAWIQFLKQDNQCGAEEENSDGDHATDHQDRAANHDGGISDQFLHAHRLSNLKTGCQQEVVADRMILNDLPGLLLQVRVLFSSA
jgi:hypothetical protein